MLALAWPGGLIMNIAVRLSDDVRFKWTDENITRLRELALEGLSASQIGLIFGTTRNSVIGKCHRVGVKLVSRGEYAAPRLGKPATDRKRQARNATPGGASSKSGDRLGFTRSPTATQQPNATIANWFNAASKTAVNQPRHLTLAQLEASSCRFPLGDPCHESFRFCGAVRKGSLPYCAECAERAYIIPPPPKPRSWRRP